MEDLERTWTCEESEDEESDVRIESDEDDAWSQDDARIARDVFSGSAGLDMAALDDDADDNPVDIRIRRLAGAVLLNACEEALNEALFCYGAGVEAQAFSKRGRTLKQIGTGVNVSTWLADTGPWEMSPRLSFSFCLEALRWSSRRVYRRLAGSILKNAINLLCRRACQIRGQLITGITPDDFVAIPVEHWFGANAEPGEVLTFSWCCAQLGLDREEIRLDVARVVRDYTRDWDNADLDVVVEEYAAGVVAGAPRHDTTICDVM